MKSVFLHTLLNVLSFKLRLCYLTKKHIQPDATAEASGERRLDIAFRKQRCAVNYPANVYKYRQDSSFLYFYGQHREGLVGVIDIDNQKEYLIGNDIDIEDIVWFGAVDSVADLAAQSGVEHSAPMSRLEELITQARTQGRKIHFLPPYRHDQMIQLMD